MRTRDPGNGVGMDDSWPPRRMHQGQKQLASSQSTCLRVSFDFSIVRSFAVMILCLQINANVACFIEIRVDFFCDTTRTIIHFRRSQIKHDFKSPWLWALNRGISYISFHYLYMELAQSLSGGILFGIGGKVL